MSFLQPKADYYLDDGTPVFDYGFQGKIIGRILDPRYSIEEQEEAYIKEKEFNRKK